MPRIVCRPRAESDLLDIWLWLAEHSVTAADRISDLLGRKFQILAEQPYLGSAREELLADLRMFPAGEYLIFYRPLEDGIEIIRVLHAARDVGSQFSTSAKTH